MDEPSMGLAPVLVAQNFDIIDQINRALDNPQIRCRSTSAGTR